MLSDQTKLKYYNILNGVKLQHRQPNTPFDVTISDVKLTYKDINLHYIKDKNYFVEAPPRPKFDKFKPKDRGRDRNFNKDQHKKHNQNKKHTRPRSEERPGEKQWDRPKKIHQHDQVLDKKLLERMQQQQRDRSQQRLHQMEKSRERFNNSQNNNSQNSHSQNNFAKPRESQHSMGSLFDDNPRQNHSQQNRQKSNKKYWKPMHNIPRNNPHAHKKRGGAKSKILVFF
jgi:hypothetical protein